MIYKVQDLPDIDQSAIRKGRCPWCLEPLVDGQLLEGHHGDICPQCNDEFTGKITLAD